MNIVYTGPLENGRVFRELYSPFYSGFTEQMIAWTNLGTVILPIIIVEGSMVTGKPHNQYSILANYLLIDNPNLSIHSAPWRGSFSSTQHIRNAIVFSVTYPPSGDDEVA